MRVRIVASDEAEAVLEKFKKRLDSARKPTEALGKATNRVAHNTRELGRATSSDIFGRVSNGLRSVGREASTAFHGIGRLSAGLGTLTELGGLGGAGIAGAALGIAGLVKHWSSVGVATTNAAANIGVTTAELYRYQRAAALVGVSGDSVTGNLTGLNQTVWQATKGLNPNAANMLNLLQVNATGAHGAMLPLAQILPKIADSIDKLPAAGQMAAISDLGMSPDMLPFLRQGGSAITKQMAQLQAQGVGDNFGGANDTYADFQKLETSAGNVADKLAKQFAPDIDKVTGSLTNFLSFVPGWLKAGTDPASASVLNNINSGAAAGGSWLHNEAISAGHWWNKTFGPQSSDGEKATTAEQNAARAQGMAYFQTQTDPNTGKPWTKANAASIVGNAEQESSLNPNATWVDPQHMRPTTFGFMQWDPTRIAQLQKAGIDVTKGPMQQWKAVQWELTHTETAAAAALSASKSAGDGAIALDRTYERSADGPFLEFKRASYATYDDKLNYQAPAATGAARALSAGLMAEIAHRGNGEAASGEVTVNVNHNNVPAGTTTSTTSSGKGAKVGAVRITKSMTGLNA